MSVDPQALNPILTPAVIVEPRRRRWPWLALATAVVVGLGWGWASGSIRSLFVEEGPALALLTVDRGPLGLYLVETGSLESARNTSIKCQVESLLGTTGGAAGTGRTGSTGSSTTGAGTTSGSSSSYGQSSSSASTTSSAKAKATAAPKAGSASGTTAATGTGASMTVTSAASSSSSSTDSSSSVSRPTIRSFSYAVAKYTPLKTASSTKATTKASTTASSGSAGGMGGGGGGGGGGGSRGGGGGGGRGGGGGGGGGGNQQQEKAGSTRIIWLKPEGSEVKAGEVICELDSSAFKDELQAQKIRWAQAKAVVDQAQAIYDVNDITYREYKDGIFPQDAQLIKQYIVQCETQADRARRAESWSREMLKKNFRAPAQYTADKLALDQAEMMLREAKEMEERLDKFTAPKLIKGLEAKLQSIRADKLAQEASFGIEDDRLHRIERMIANCTIKAPADGILVYNNQSDPRSGQIEIAIQEGVTVREGQTLFDLPDPTRMRVRVRVNESKMSLVRSGQRALVFIEAFPGQEMTGVVTEITPIPANVNRFSDVKAYLANVEIDSGKFEGLRPGMSARVSFLIDAKTEDVTRVPLQAVRWAGGRPFVAVAGQSGGATRWDWRPIEIGLVAPGHAEILKGVSPGERVVADPSELPAPDPARFPAAETRTASAPGGAPHGG